MNLELVNIDFLNSGYNFEPKIQANLLCGEFWKWLTINDPNHDTIFEQRKQIAFELFNHSKLFTYREFLFFSACNSLMVTVQENPDDNVRLIQLIKCIKEILTCKIENLVNLFEFKPTTFKEEE